MKLFKKADKEQKAKRVRNLRRLRYGTTSTVVTAAVIAAVILLNVIVGVVADKFPVTLDLSSDKVFTLTEDSVKIAAGIQNEMEIVVFSAESEFENPTFGAGSGIPEYDTTIKEFYNALKQYKSHSNDKLTYTFIDPNQEPAKYAAYSKYEVQNGSILFLCGDRYKTCTMEDLYALDTSDYYNSGNYTFESKVEKVLASNIHNLQSGNEQIVQVLVGHEEDTYTIQGLKELYELNGYAFEELTISGSAAFNKDATVALIPAPSKDYSAADIKKVQEWVYNDGNYGRHLLVYVSATADCPNLYEFLDVEYDIQVTDELILETDFNRLQNYNVAYPMADIPDTDYTADSQSTAKLFTPQARRITSSLEEYNEENGGVNYKVQLNNYPETASLITLEDFEENKSENLFDGDVHDAPLEEYPFSSMMMTVIDYYNNNTSQAVSGSVTVSGCAAMAYAEFVQNGSFKNEDLLLETLNTVTGTDSGITISNKVLSADTVTFSGGVQLLVGLGLFTVGLPVLMLVICLVVFLRRKNL